MSQFQQQMFADDPVDPVEPAPEDDDRLVATVVFSEPPGGPFDYVIPTNLQPQVTPGQRVRVPLGKSNRQIVGYCVAVGPRPSDVPWQLKEILETVDQRPLLSEKMLKLTRWMANYYIASWGQVLEAVVPAGVRSLAGTRLVTFYQLAADLPAELSELRLPAKQKRVMDVLQAGEGPIEANRLASLADCTQAPLKSLAGKGLLVASKQRLHREQLDEQATEREQPLELNEDQEPALAAVLAACRSGQQQTILAYGVTGSGKTEVYMQAVEDVVRSGRQAIVLVPEISLTPQTRQRFRARFDQVAVLHSQLSDAERHWHWQRIADGQVQVVVGPRSAIFAPTPQLGLIVLDEEHEPSFKQETTPRYHARDVALERAKLEAIPLVLGSATPALESWQRAISGEFQLVRLPNRVLGRPLPEVATIDLCHERRSRSKGAISRVLEQAMRQALDQDGQIILLLNRRGFSTSIQCPACGHVVRCPQCDVAVTHHRQQVGGKAERVLCHYCDYEARVPSACPECRSEEIRFAGLGTQRLEAEVNARFRGSVCLRMDSDTMRGPGSHEKALQRFRDGEVQILVGTQMIAKGLDFPDVTLVGVVNADTALHFPDFRAAERTFQLVTQVAGRTGRSERGGRVLVQTYSPDHPAIQAAAGHQFEDFARQELPLREKFGYPPYSSLIRLIVRGDVEDATAAFAQRLVDELATLVADSVSYRVLGPAPAPITRVREKYRFHLLLVTDELSQLSEPLEQLIQQLPGPDTIQWVIDVDPLSLL